MVEEVLVVRSELITHSFNHGFCSLTDEYSISDLLFTATFMPRPLAEADPTYKQIIPYSILRFGQRIFRYQRTRSGGEARLFGQHSIGVGGHINPEDQSPDEVDMSGVFDRARIREIQEEFACRLHGVPRLLGMINDNSNPVGQVHLGIVSEYQLADENIQPNEVENFARYGLVDRQDLLAADIEYETWSQIVIDQIQKNWQ
jgi:predicted NUDIX family phosphoesterase